MQSDTQIAIRVSTKLLDDIRECAKRSGCSIAAQIRFELEERRGMVPKMYLPHSPSHDGTTPKKLKKVG